MNSKELMILICAGLMVANAFFATANMARYAITKQSKYILFAIPFLIGAISVCTKAVLIILPK